MGNKCDKCGAELIKLFSSMACPNGCDKQDQSDNGLSELRESGDREVKHKLLRELANYNTFADHHKKCYVCQSEDLRFKQFRWKQAMECGNCGIRSAARPTEEEALRAWQEICDKARDPLYEVKYKTANNADYEATKEMLKAGFENGLISANTFMSELEKLFARNNQRIVDEQHFLMKKAANSFIPRLKQEINIEDISMKPGSIIHAEEPSYHFQKSFTEEYCRGIKIDRQISDIFYCTPKPDPKADEEYLIGDACLTYESRKAMENKTHFFGIHVWNTPKLHEIHGNELINCILEHGFYPPGTWTDGIPEGEMTEVVYPARLCRGRTYHGHLFIKRDGSVIVKFIHIDPFEALPAWKDSTDLEENRKGELK